MVLSVPAALRRVSAASLPLALAAGGLALAMHAVRVLDLFGLRYTDEDQAIMWYGAQEFLHLHFREPCIYGQNYLTMLDSVPSALLVGLGVPVWKAVPIASLLLGLTPWVVLAVLAWRMGSRFVAPLLLAFPLLLPAGYSMLVALGIADSDGLFLTALAMLLAYGKPGTVRAFFAGALAPMAAWATPNCALVLVPAGLWLLWEHRKSWRVLVPGGVGAALGALIFPLSKRFYETHPAYSLHHAWELQYSFAKLGSTLPEVSRYWGDVSPAWLGSPWVFLTLILAAGIFLFVRKQFAEGIALLVGIALIIGSLGANKVHDGEASVFFSLARMYLGIPVLAGLAILFVSRALPAPAWLPERAPQILALVLVMLGIGRWASLPSEVDSVVARPTYAVTPVKIAELVDTCQRLEAEAKGRGVRWIFGTNRSIAYGCGAVAYGEVAFLVPDYERRTWLLQQSAAETVDRVMLKDVPAERSCGLLSRYGVKCEPLEPDLASVELPRSAPALAVAAAAGFRVRRF